MQPGEDSAAVADETMRDAEHLWFAVRELGPSDIGLQRAFFDGLSREALYWRFMGPKQSVSEPLLKHLASTDGRRHVAFMGQAPIAGRPKMIAEARYVVDAADPALCEFAIAVADDWQGRGIASKLLRRLENRARAAGIGRMAADTLRTNVAMISLARKAGYTAGLNSRDARTMRLSKRLAGAAHTLHPSRTSRSLPAISASEWGLGSQAPSAFGIVSPAQ